MHALIDVDDGPTPRPDEQPGPVRLPQLPADVLRHAVSFLPVLDALRAASACRALASAVSEASWRVVTVSTGDAEALFARADASAATRTAVSRLGARLAPCAEELTMTGWEHADGDEWIASVELLRLLLAAGEGGWPRLRALAGCAADGLGDLLAERCPRLERLALHGGALPAAALPPALVSLELRGALCAPVAIFRAMAARPARLRTLLVHRGCQPEDEDEEEEDEEGGAEGGGRDGALRALAERHGAALEALSLWRLPRGGAPRLAALLPRLTELHLESALHSPDGRRRAARALGRALAGLPSLRRLSASCAAAAARAPRAFRRGSVRVLAGDLLRFLRKAPRVECIELEGAYHCSVAPEELAALARATGRHGASLERLALPKLFLATGEGDEGEEGERAAASALAAPFLATLAARCPRLRSLSAGFGGRGEEPPREAHRWRWGSDTGGGWHESEGSSSEEEGVEGGQPPPRPPPRPASPPASPPPEPLHSAGGGAWLAALPPRLERLSAWGLSDLAPADVQRCLAARPALRLSLRRVELGSANLVGAWREASPAAGLQLPAALYECDLGEGTIECVDVGACDGPEGYARPDPHYYYVM